MVAGLVSVVIPTYSRPRFLNRALASVFAQSYTRWEVIVVDDNEPDSEARRQTQSLLASYEGPRFTYVLHERNKGGAAARNTGVSVSSGEYVAFLDDDDAWLPQKLERQLLLFAGRERLVSYTGRQVVNARGEVTATVEPVLRGRILERLLERNRIGSTSSILCRRVDLIEAGLFDEAFPASQDYDLYVRLATRCDFEYVVAPLLVFHQHDEARVTRDAMAKYRAVKLFCDKHRALFAQYPQAHLKYLKFYAQFFVAVGEREAARDVLTRAARLKPWDAELFIYNILTRLEPDTVKTILNFRRRLRGVT